MELPGLGRQVGEAKEVLVLQLDVPLELLPTGCRVPPVAGDGEGPPGGGDAPAVRAGEEGQRAGVGAVLFKGDGDLEGGAETGQRGAAGRPAVLGGLRGLVAGVDQGVGGPEVEGVGAVGEGGDGEANAIGSEESFEADQGVGQAVGLAELVAEEFVLAGTASPGDQGEGEAGDGGGKPKGFEMGFEGRQQHFG